MLTQELHNQQKALLHTEELMKGMRRDVQRFEEREEILNQVEASTSP